MDIGSWSSGIVVAVIGALGAVAQTRRRPNVREQIKSDIEIHRSLPAESKMGQKFLERIDDEIAALIRLEQESSRDVSGVVLACVLLAAGGWTTYLAVAAGGAWLLFLIGTGLLIIFGLVGLTESLPRVRRDEKGNRIKG